MLTLSHLLAMLATGFYGLSFFTALVFKRRPSISCLLLTALAANGAAVGIRYHQAWPMLPMYLGSVALPLTLGILTLVAGRQDPSGRVRRVILAFALLTAAAAVLFPKDFYLPFLQSQSLAAHLFFILGVMGRGCFMVSAAWALMGLRDNEKKTGNTISTSPAAATLHWTVWGFAFWTFSMFAGELWSYLGWGTPVVWDDPAITTAMATWFFYVCLLHLHLTGTWSARSRSIYAAFGVVVVLGLNCLPEWGPFRWLF